MGNTPCTSLFNRNSNGYTALFSTSKGGETAGSVAFGPNGTSIAYGGETAGSIASSFSGGSSSSSGSSCGSFTAIG